MVVLGDRHGGSGESSESAEEISALMDAWRTCGLQVEVVAWEEATRVVGSRPPAVLPLLAWSYSETTAAAQDFCKLLQTFQEGGAQPALDLRAIPWMMHKRYLLELEEAGLPVVPTIVLPARTTNAAAEPGGFTTTASVRSQLSWLKTTSVFPAAAVGGALTRLASQLWLLLRIRSAARRALLHLSE